VVITADAAGKVGIEIVSMYQPLPRRHSTATSAVGYSARAAAAGKVAVEVTKPQHCRPALFAGEWIAAFDCLRIAAGRERAASAERCS